MISSYSGFICAGNNNTVGIDQIHFLIDNFITICDDLRYVIVRKLFTPSHYMLKNYFDIIKKYVYNIKIDSKQEDWCMTISEQIKVLCVRCGVSEAELARRLGKSPQSFNSKMKRESFTVEDLENIADVLGVEFNREFILANGDKV